MTSASNDNGGPSGAMSAPCPICKSPPIAAYAPFCCKHCADVDLHRWLSGVYAIPAVEEDGGDGTVSGEDEPF